MELLSAKGSAVIVSWAILSVSALVMTSDFSIAQNSPGSSDAGRTLLLGNPLLGNVTPADPDDSIADANAPAVSGSTEASLSGAPDDFRRRVGTYLDVLQILANSYDGRRFSVAGQAELLSRDSDRIIEFVTRKIAFEPYAGSLRGPLGTLLTRSGNALDQSRLLAELLSELGLEVRIGATSADPELNELLSSLYFDQQRQVPNESLGAGVAESVATALNISTEQVLKGIADAQAAQVLQAGALVERADRWSAELAAILGDKIDAASNLPLEFDEIHYRVDYRSRAGEWRSVDPTGAGHSEISVGDTLYAADELPASAFHTFAIDLKLRVEKPDGELQDIGLLTWQAPSAKLFDRTIQVSVFPSDFEAIVTADDFDAAFSETDDYTATISLDNGDLDIARFFDLNGEVFDTPPNPEIAQAEDQAAAITGGLGGIGGALGGIFGGDPTAEPATTPEETGTIIGLWATYTLSSPTNNLERTRIVLPAVEVVDWQDGQATTRSSDWTKTELQKQLIWNTQLHVMTGPTAPDFVSHRILSSILAGRAAIEASLDAVVGAENTAQALGASLNAFTEGVSSGTSFEAMILAASGQELSRQQIETSNASSRIYSPTAGLVAFERRASVPDELTEYLTLTETYDVIEMPGVVITAAGSEPKENFRNGVMWTAVEQALSEQKQSTLGTPDEATLTRFGNAGQALDAARSHAGANMIFFDASGDWPAQLEQFQTISPRSKAALARDLTGGYSVVATEVPEFPTTVWWRANPNTGFVLGTSIDDRGAALTERAVYFNRSLLISQATMIACLLSSIVGAESGGGASYVAKTVAGCAVVSATAGLGFAATPLTAIEGGSISAVLVFVQGLLD